MVNKHLLGGLLVSALIHTFLFFSFAKIGFYQKLKEEKRYVKISLRFFKLKNEVKKKNALNTSKKGVKGKVRKIKKKKYTRKKHSKKFGKVIKKKVRKVKKKTQKPTKVVRKAVRNKGRKYIKKQKQQVVTDIKRQVFVPSFEEKGKVKKLSAKRSKELAYVNRKVDKGKKFLEENLDLIRSIVLENITYPYIARRMGWEGTVVISFFLSESGCDRVRIERSSGFEVLDNEAKNTVERLCDKFPKPKTKVLVKLPVKFILRD